MKTLKALLQKRKDIVLYVVFGGLTTLVNIVTYAAFTRLVGMGEMGSVISNRSRRGPLMRWR